MIVVVDVLVDVNENPPIMSHERLDVYRGAVQFLAMSVAALERFPRGNAALADQLRRISLSISLNIAEGAGKPSAGDRARYFAVARGSALECAAILDACLIMKLVDSDQARQGKLLLARAVAMLSKMCR